MSFESRDNLMILTMSPDAAFESMAEVLIWRLTQSPLSLTDRQKRLGKALFRFIASRSSQRLLNLGNPNYTPYQTGGKP